MNRLQHFLKPIKTQAIWRVFPMCMLFLACFLTSHTLVQAQVNNASTCEYILELTDTGVDGWDGAYLEVSIDNDIPVNYSVQSGTGSKVINLPVNNGSTIDLYYHGAAFESQHFYQLTDAQGNVVHVDGPSPAEGAVETIKATCPVTCTGAENYFVLITVGDYPEEMSWELTNQFGARLAYANANTYMGLPPGTQIPVVVSLTSCEAYTFTTFDGVNNGWNNGSWQILSLDANRGTAVADPTYAGYYEIAAGPGVFVDQATHQFTLPCIECPEDILQIVNTTNCEYTGFVFPAANVPTPVICYPDIHGHGSPAPMITVSYPTATPPVVGLATTTPVDLPVGSNPAIFEVTYTDGQVVKCTSHVNIISSMNPTLICNDNVNISLNEPDAFDNDGSGSLSDDLGECVLEITPDMVLEMPGFCEGEFAVTIVDMDGNELDNRIGPDMIGQVLQYRVNHIASNNICWGTVTVEDKLPPTINCRDYEIACNHPYALDELYRNYPSFKPTEGSLPANIAGGGSFPAPPSITTLDFDIGCVPLGENFWNAVVDLEISHTDIGDLEIILLDPLGNTYILMNAGTCPQGTAQDINVTFSSTGSHPSITKGCENGTINGTYSPISDLSFDLPFGVYGGTWQVIITDSNNTSFPDGEVGLGEVVDATLKFTTGFPAGARAYDCTPVTTNMISETIVETNCSEPWIGSEIHRVWRATDASGNISSCLQTVKLRTPTFEDIRIPEDVSLACGSSTAIEDAGVPTFDCFDINDDHHGLCDISYTYDDTEIPTCGQGKKLIREWTIVNWCSSTTKEYSQVIKVEDKEGPVITANDIQTGSAIYECEANIELSTFVTDACSDVAQITASYVLNGGNYNALSGDLYIVDITNTGTITGLPEGTTEVLITAQDGCGNNSIDTIQITVIDDVPPAAICDDNLHVTLNGGGLARIYAEDIDEGSFDNCGIASLEVRRTNGCLGVSEFDEFVDFSCCDIGEPVTVELKVTDYNGNSSLCWLPIQIEDKLPPIITCPTNKTINCDDGFASLSQFGSANAIDNCEVELEIEEMQDIDNCGAGLITRSWTATDPSGNQNACTQSIVIQHVSDFAIQFPEDAVVNSCSGDFGNTGEPLINDNDCELIAVSHEDQVFDVVPDACFKVIRTWTVINWCTYDLNAENTNLGTELPTPRTYQDDGDGYFEYTQVIKVVDIEAPVIDESSVADVTVEVINDCSETFFAPKATALDDCAGSIDVDPFPSSVTGTPGDEAVITYNANDGCGNTDTHTITVHFIDAKKPTPVCINGLSIELMSTGQVVIWASDFEIGSSYDNCTAYENLRFSFSEDVDDTGVQFTCADLGTQIVELWATDQAGNQDYCSTYVIVQDNMNVCEDDDKVAVAIGGLIQDEQGRQVEDVTITVEGSNALPYTTGIGGNYAFPDLGMFGSYDVAASKNMNPTNGVSTFDLVLMSQHILGTAELDSPYKLIAGDVNNDGNITTFDIIQTRQLILSIVQDFPTNTSWRFIDANYVFPNPMNPFAAPFPEIIKFQNIDSNELNADFVAVKIGDVDGNAIPNTLFETEERNDLENLVFAIDNKMTEAGTVQVIDFKASDFNAMLGYQFTMKFDSEALDFVAIEGSALDVTDANFGLTHVDEGFITTSWNTNEELTVAKDEVLFSLVFTAKVTAPISTLLKINSRYTAAEAYTKKAGMAELLDVSISFENDHVLTAANEVFELYQNRPNPFSGETVIGFNLPQASTAALKIYNVSGKLIYVTQNDFSKGYNEITVQQTELATSGILYYTLETPLSTATKKMIIVK